MDICQRMRREELEQVLGDITFRDWEFHLAAQGRGYLLQIQFLAPDTNDPSRMDRQRCRWWYIDPEATPAEVVRTAWKAVEAAVLHEAQELFRYRGAVVYDPHLRLGAHNG